MTAPVEDEFTELVDADIPRVDLVDKAANGMRFLLAKQAGGRGLLDPEFVRELVAKAEPEQRQSETRDDVTVTGSPAAIAKLIHQAAVRASEPVAKEKHDTADREHAAATGAAMPDGSYPIEDRADLERAIHAVGRGGADHDAIRRHVITRAKALGASSEIPDNWNADGSLKGSVTKEQSMTAPVATDALASVAKADDDLDPATVLAELDEMYDGIETNPGSPAWEAVDAATARKWTSILARAKGALDLLADREMLEAASGDEDDATQSMDLQDACCAIDYAISILAPFAVAEQAEADCGDDMQAIGKALRGFDTAPLDLVEALAPVRKAGRVLSSANEAAIRDAVDKLQKVLASLPAAPVEKAGAPVVTTPEEPDMTSADLPTPETSAETVAAHGEQPKMGVAKADDVKPQMVAVYDANGKLVGVVDPSEITRIAGAEPDKDDEPEATDEAPAAAPEGEGMQPAPAAEVGTPADAVLDDVEKTTAASSGATSTTGTPDDVSKSIADQLKQILDSYSAAQAETVSRLEKTVATQAETIEVLKGRVQVMEEQPAQPKVFTNGAVPPVPPGTQLRGQDRGAAPVDVTKAQELKKTLYHGTAPEQNQAFVEMQELAVARLAELHQRH